MTPDGFDWLASGGARLLVPSFFRQLSLRGGYTTRLAEDGAELDLDLRGGKDESRIRSNRTIVSRGAGLNPEWLVFAEQTHSNVAAAVTPADRGRGAVSYRDAISGADALVTGSRDIPLAILAADCAVVLIADADRRAVAAVHSGRRGAALNVTASAVAGMAALGASPPDLYAAIGPCIRQCCYEVGQEVAAEFQNAFAWGREVAKISGGKAHLDLPGAIARQLRDAGLRRDRVFDCGLCTACRTDLFFSYRKEGGAAGRCAGVIAIA